MGDIEGIISHFSDQIKNNDVLELMVMFHDFTIYSSLNDKVGTTLGGIRESGFSGDILKGIAKYKGDGANYEEIYPHLFEVVLLLSNFLALSNLTKKSLEILISHREEVSPVLDMCPAVRTHLGNMGINIQSDLDGEDNNEKGTC